jgi:hypothetical protein
MVVRMCQAIARDTGINCVKWGYFRTDYCWGWPMIILAARVEFNHRECPPMTGDFSQASSNSEFCHKQFVGAGPVPALNWATTDCPYRKKDFRSCVLPFHFGLKQSRDSTLTWSGSLEREHYPHWKLRLRVYLVHTGYSIGVIMRRNQETINCLTG